MSITNLFYYSNRITIYNLHFSKKNITHFSGDVLKNAALKVRKVTRENFYILQLSQKPYIGMSRKVTLFRNFAMKGCNATKSEPLTKFFIGVSKLSGNIQEELCNRFLFSKLQVCKLQPSALRVCHIPEIPVEFLFTEAGDSTFSTE